MNDTDKPEMKVLTDGTRVLVEIVAGGGGSGGCTLTMAPGTARHFARQIEAMAGFCEHQSGPNPTTTEAPK